MVRSPARTMRACPCRRHSGSRPQVAAPGSSLLRAGPELALVPDGEDADDVVHAFFAEESRHPVDEGPPMMGYFRQALALGGAPFFPAARARA